MVALVTGRDDPLLFRWLWTLLFDLAVVLPNGLIAAGKPRALVPSETIDPTLPILQKLGPLLSVGVNRLTIGFLPKVIPLPQVEINPPGPLVDAPPTRPKRESLPLLLLTTNALLKTPRW